MKTFNISLHAMLLLAVWLVTSHQPASGATHTVNFRSNVFEPSTLTVNVGDTVVFENKGGFHTVTGTGADPFCGNGAIAPRCSVTFNTAGTFPYKCNFHPGMGGSITVVGVPVEKPNLAPFRPNGWSHPLVVSRVAGNNTADPDFFDNQDIFVDWAIANVSLTAGIPGTFFTELLIDNVSVASWSHDGLTPDTFNRVEDANVGKLAAGEHVFKLVTDHTGVVDESNELDNTYEMNVRVIRPFTGVTHTVNFRNNVFEPSTLTVNVGDTVVFENKAGSHTVTGTGADPFCGDNPVPLRCSRTFNTAGTFPYRCNFHPGMGGSITVVGTPVEKPNLVPFRPNGWSHPLVVSRVAGNNIADPDFFSDRDIFVDWAIANVSLTAGIPGTFFTELLIDGVSVLSWSHDGLSPDTFNSIQDANVGKLAAGQHVFRLVTDHTGVVGESDENDNTYDMNVRVIPPFTAVVHTVEMRDFEFVPAVLTIKTGDIVQVKKIEGFHTVTGTTPADPFCGDLQIDNLCVRTFNQVGDFPYRCLFHSSDGPVPEGMVGLIRVVNSVGLSAASRVDGSYSPVAGATVDFTTHTVSVPKPNAPTFWRLVSDLALRIKTVETTASSIVIHFE